MGASSSRLRRAALRIALAGWLVLTGCSELKSAQVWGLEERRVFVSGAKGGRPPDLEAQAFHVLNPPGVERHLLAASARQSLVIGRGVKIVRSRTGPSEARSAYVASWGKALLAPESLVGALYAGGSPTIVEPGASVELFVRSVRPAQVTGARIGLGVLENVPPQAERFEWKVDFPAQHQGDRVSRRAEGAPLDLLPGSYAHVVVEGGSRMTLHTGHYHVRSLDLRPGALLEIDNAAGAVYLWVRDSLALGGSMVEHYLKPSVLVGFAGRSRPAITSAIRATVVAPWASVELPQTDDAHSGSVFAEAIQIADNAAFEHRPFALSRARPSEQVCRVCAESAADVARNCCNQLNRIGAGQDSARAACDASAGADAHAAAYCRARSGADRAEARQSFELCLHDVLFEYGDCLLRYAYRPDTCAKLGYAAYDASSCSF